MNQEECIELQQRICDALAAWKSAAPGVESRTAHVGLSCDMAAIIAKLLRVVTEQQETIDKLTGANK